MILGLVIGAFAMGIMGVVMFLHFSKAKATASAHDEEHYEEESPDQYASKVAALEQNWQEADASMDQSAW
jgi:flagellar basal body-associated protein FliL